MPMIELPNPDPAADTSPGLKAYVAMPTTPGPWPGVVVVHEIFGLDEVMMRQCDHLASLGYLAVMPDLFVAGGARRCLRATFKALTAGHGRAFDDLEAAKSYLISRDDCTDKVGVVGFCMGGAFALLLATRGYDASSVNYGRLPKDLTELVGACPIVASYGGSDVSLRGAAATLEGALRRLDVPHDVKEYPGAGHAFLNDARNGPKPLRPLLKVLGMGPEPTSAADAWARIEAFFTAHLRP